MNRREFIRTFGAGVAALAGTKVFGPLGQAYADEKAPAGTPNIIFIMMDDMGYGDVGIYGQKHIRMPNVDKMAREGIRYTNVCTGSPVCAPSRSCLMTGMHTGHTTVRGNSGQGGVPGPGGLRVPLKKEDVTVAEVLKGAGYVTGMTGKWGLGEPGTDGIPNLQGFDEWLGFLNQNLAHSYYPTYIWHNQEQRNLEGNTGTTDASAKEKHYVHDMFTDYALDFIKRHGSGDKPFFLYLPYTIPHDALQVPELEPYTEDTDWPRNAKAYASMLTRADRDIGRIFALLRELKIDDETIVFFCSDNGAANRYDGLFDSSGQLRGRKRDVYEGGLRTVMIARWPGVIKPGTVSKDVWYFPDVLPTLAGLAGVKPPDQIDGISVEPSLRSKPQPELRDRPLYWEFYEGGFQQAARKGDWKAVRPAQDKPIELYNLAEDIGEQNNLADRHPERVKWFDEYMRKARTPSPSWPSPLDTEQGAKP